MVSNYFVKLTDNLPINILMNKNMNFGKTVETGIFPKKFLITRTKIQSTEVILILASEVLHCTAISVGVGFIPDVNKSIKKASNMLSKLNKFSSITFHRHYT